MDGIFYILSFFAIIVVFYAILRTTRNKDTKSIKEKHKDVKSAKGDYDERQIAIRGKGFKIGFFLYMIEFAFLLFSDGAEVNLPLTSGALYAILFCIPLAVFLIYCIKHDAFVGVQSNMKRFIVMAVLVVIVNLASTITQIVSGTMIVDGKITNDCISPICCLLFMTVLIALIIRNNQIKAEQIREKRLL